MYAHRIFALQWLISCLFLVAADVQEKPKQSLVERWIQLAQDLHAGKIGYFHKLPLEVQENIFSRIHPSPSLDDWRSNNALCVRTMVVPHEIVSFDLKGDRFAYMSPRMILNGCDKDKYLPHWIDLQTGEHRVLCEKGEGYDGSFGKFPAIQLCDDVAIVEEFSPKHFSGISLFDKPLPDYLNNGNSASYPVKTFDWGGGESIQCATHPSLPLCAVSYASGHLNEIYICTYENAKKIREITFSCSNVDDVQKHILTWHCSSNKLCIYKPGVKLLDIVRTDKHWQQTKDIKGIPYSSPGDSSLHAKYDDGVKRVDIATATCTTYFRMNSNNFLLHGAGHATYFIEKSDQDGVGTKQYSLHTLKDQKATELTELDNLPPLHKLPTSHDYRCVTVEPCDDGHASTIKIFVPKTYVMFKHYCMLQAALEAQKNGGWQHFSVERNKQLVDETKMGETNKGYALFSKLMDDHVTARKT